MKVLRNKFILLISFVLCINSLKSESKIVGLVTVRHDTRFIENCLKTLALYVDSAIVLNKILTNDSRQVIESLKEDCKVEKVINGSEVGQDEYNDKLKLLASGREANGTHFILLDDDEILSAQCTHNDFLKKKILSLKPGESISLPLVNLWKNINFYLTFPGLPQVKCIYCDSPKAFLPEENDLKMQYVISRIPEGLDGKCEDLKDINYVVINFSYVSWRNSLIKKVWYMCKSFLDNNDAALVNQNYALDLSDLEFDKKTMVAKTEWFEYIQFNKYFAYEDENFYKQDILKFFEKYGRKHFKDLQIWNLPIETLLN